MKFKKLLMLLCASPLLLLTSCKNDKNAKGYVIKKNHTYPFVTTMTALSYSNGIMKPTIFTIYHFETWSLNLRDEDKGKYKEYIVYLKDSNVWETIQIGDYFIWSEDICYECEPTSKEQ